MVSIPTSRDIGRIGTRSGRPSVSGPSVSVGAAIVNAGQAMTEVAYDLDALRQQETVDAINKRSLDTSTALTRFADEEERRFLKAQEESTESGIGFTRSYMEGYQQRANAFAKEHFEGLSDEQASGYLNQILGRGNALYEKAYSFESTAKSNFYDRTVNQGLDTVRGEIAGNAAPFEQLYSQGLTSINSADMPEAWKAERRAFWEQDAAESRWQWEYRKDPQAAVDALSNVRHTDVATGIVAAANSLGVDPEELATAISYETGGTFDPTKSGPTTKWGTHRGLIQFGEPQAEEYGVDWNDPVASQLGPNGAIVRYLREAGVEPGMGLLDIYSAINAGQVGLYDARDAQAGGAPGTVRDKVEQQMDAHREKAQNLLAGSYTPSQFDSIPYERRVQLASKGQTEIDQTLTQQRAAEKDRIGLVIAADPFSIDRETILSSPVLDNGDKAALIKSWNTATKDERDAGAFMAAVAAGNASVNPFDSNQTKVAEKAYDSMLRSAPEASRQAATQAFVEATGYIPKAEVAVIRQEAMSMDAAAFATSMVRARRMQTAAPEHFSSVDGFSGVRRDLERFEAYTQNMGYSAEDAASRILQSKTAEGQLNEELLGAQADKIAKEIEASAIASQFDDSFLGVARNPGAGADITTQNMLVSDYRQAFRERYLQVGDEDEAKALASADIKKTWGVSETSGSRQLMKFPPEMFYPPVSGAHTYLRDDAVETASDLGGAEPTNVHLRPWIDPSTGRNLTAEDVRAGRPPRYRLIYEREENGQTIIDMAPSTWAVPEEDITRLTEAENAKAMREAQESRQFQEETIAPVANEVFPLVQNALEGRAAPAIEDARRASRAGAAMGTMLERIEVNGDAPEAQGGVVMPGPINPQGRAR